MYPPNYVNEIPLTEMGLTVGPGRTHMFYTGTPEFAFGAGLSYTDWAMAWPSQDKGEDLVLSLSADAGATTELQVELSNTGGSLAPLSA